MSFEKDHTEEAIKLRGEVFTPEALVEEMLGKLPPDFFTDASKTMLDNSCGNGNFLVKILEWRLKNGISHLDAIKTIYGIELDPANAQECRERLSLGKKDKEIWDILNHNIITADALDPKHKGWKDVGYMWDGKSVTETAMATVVDHVPFVVEGKKPLPPKRKRVKSVVVNDIYTDGS